MTSEEQAAREWWDARIGVAFRQALTDDARPSPSDPTDAVAKLLCNTMVSAGVADDFLDRMAEQEYSGGATVGPCMLEQIITELHRLDPSGNTKAKRDGRRVSIYEVGFEGEPVVVRRADALRVLRALPTGCKLEEGVDGSMWEALLVLCDGGLGEALDYVREFHGYPKSPAIDELAIKQALDVLKAAGEFGIQSYSLTYITESGGVVSMHNVGETDGAALIREVRQAANALAEDTEQ